MAWTTSCASFPAARRRHRQRRQLGAPIATDDGNNYIFTGYDFFKDYRYPADPSVYEIYEGSISADPDAPLILRLYYGAAIQHLDFYIGDVDFDMDGNPDAEWLIDKPEADYRTGSKVTLPVGASAQRPGYTLVGWYEAPTAADGEAVSNLVGTLARDWHDTYISADFFHPVGSEWRMANHDTILYAVWRANNDTEYTVEVWVIQGDGTEDHLPQYDVNAKGITGDKVVHGDDVTTPANPYAVRNPNDGTRESLAGDPYNYDIKNVWGYTYDATRTGTEGVGYVSAEKSANGKLVLKVWYRAVENGTTFFVQNWYVPVDSQGKKLTPLKAGDTITQYGTAGSYVRVDADPALTGTGNGTEPLPFLYAHATALES